MPTIAQQLKAAGNLQHVKGTQLNSAAPALANLEFIAENNFCGHPHEVDDEIIDSDPDELAAHLDMDRDYCEHLIRGMQMMKAAATGQGSYPPNCNTDYTGAHSVSYYENTESRPAHLRRLMTEAEFQSIIDAKVWGPSGDWNKRPFTMTELQGAWGSMEVGDVVNEFCEEAYRRVGVILYQLGTTAANIDITFRIIPGSTIGIGWFPDDRACPGDQVDLHIDRGWTAGFQGQCGLKIHEFGHTLKGPHQFNGQGSHQEPMSYSYRNHLVNGYSNGDPVFGLRRAPSMDLWERYYGGEPVGVPWKGRFENTPDEPPDEPTNVITGAPNGVFVWEGKLRKILIQ